MATSTRDHVEASTVCLGEDNVFLRVIRVLVLGFWNDRRGGVFLRRFTLKQLLSLLLRNVEEGRVRASLAAPRVVRASRVARDDVVIGSVLIVVCVQLILPLLHEVRVTALCTNRTGAVRTILLLVRNISFVIRNDKLMPFFG